MAQLKGHLSQEALPDLSRTHLLSLLGSLRTGGYNSPISFVTGCFDHRVLCITHQCFSLKIRAFEGRDPISFCLFVLFDSMLITQQSSWHIVAQYGLKEYRDGEKGIKPTNIMHKGNLPWRSLSLMKWDSMVIKTWALKSGWQTLPVLTNTESSIWVPWLLGKASLTSFGQCSVNRSDMSLPDQSI